MCVIICVGFIVIDTHCLGPVSTTCISKRALYVGIDFIPWRNINSAVSRLRRDCEYYAVSAKLMTIVFNTVLGIFEKENLINLFNRENNNKNVQRLIDTVCRVNSGLESYYNNNIRDCVSVDIVYNINKCVELLNMREFGDNCIGMKIFDKIDWAYCNMLLVYWIGARIQFYARSRPELIVLLSNTCIIEYYVVIAMHCLKIIGLSNPNFISDFVRILGHILFGFAINNDDRRIKGGRIFKLISVGYEDNRVDSLVLPLLNNVNGHIKQLFCKMELAYFVQQFDVLDRLGKSMAQEYSLGDFNKNEVSSVVESLYPKGKTLGQLYRIREFFGYYAYSFGIVCLPVSELNQFLNNGQSVYRDKLWDFVYTMESACCRFCTNNDLYNRNKLGVNRSFIQNNMPIVADYLLRALKKIRVYTNGMYDMMEYDDMLSLGYYFANKYYHSIFSSESNYLLRMKCTVNFKLDHIIRVIMNHFDINNDICLNSLFGYTKHSLNLGYNSILNSSYELTNYLLNVSNYSGHDYINVDKQLICNRGFCCDNMLSVFNFAALDNIYANCRPILFRENSNYGDEYCTLSCYGESLRRRSSQGPVSLVDARKIFFNETYNRFKLMFLSWARVNHIVFDVRDIKNPIPRLRFQQHSDAAIESMINDRWYCHGYIPGMIMFVIDKDLKQICINDTGKFGFVNNVDPKYIMSALYGTKQGEIFGNDKKKQIVIDIDLNRDPDMFEQLDNNNANNDNKNNNNSNNDSVKSVAKKRRMTRQERANLPLPPDAFERSDDEEDCKFKNGGDVTVLSSGDQAGSYNDDNVGIIHSKSMIIFENGLPRNKYINNNDKLLSDLKLDTNKFGEHLYKDIRQLSDSNFNITLGSLRYPLIYELDVSGIDVSHVIEHDCTYDFGVKRYNMFRYLDGMDHGIKVVYHKDTRLRYKKSNINYSMMFIREDTTHGYNVCDIMFLFVILLL